MISFIDAHCHLDLIKGIEQNPSSEDNLPIKSISVTNAPFLFESNKCLFHGSKNIRVALGLHPELVSKYHQQLDIFEENISLTKYIGEVGLDGSADFKNSFDLQKRTFKKMLEIAAKQNDKILTIHSRNAAGETIEQLERYLKGSNCKVILHWYSGNLDSLRRAIRLGYFFSLNHKMVTTAKGWELINQIPLNQILTETDAPFTFSSSINGRIESLKVTVWKLAEKNKIDFDEMKNLIFENFRQLLS